MSFNKLSMAGMLALVLAGCAMGPSPKDEPFNPKITDEPMSKAQKLALATEVNDERNKPIRDIPREKIDQQDQDLPSGDTLGRLESAAVWKSAELGLEALSGAALTGLPALTSLLQPPDDPHRSVYSAIYAWAKTPVDYEKTEHKITRALQTALNQQVDDLERVTTESDYFDALRYIANQNGKTVRVAHSVAKEGNGAMLYNNDRDYHYGEYDPTVQKARIPAWLPKKNNALLRRDMRFFGQSPPEKPESTITGTDRAIQDNFPGVDNLQFMRDLSKALPSNMVIYFRNYEDVKSSVPLFLHEGKVYPFIEPAQENGRSSESA
jgi:hypothetical protein